MSEFKTMLSRFYPQEEVNKIERDLKNLPEKQRKIEEEKITVFFKKYGEKLPPII
ncbi:MAG: hypothetical protein ACI4DY_05535 [Monoglobaceae bacterium]